MPHNKKRNARRPGKHAVRALAPGVVLSPTAARGKVLRLREELAKMREYKRILAADGMTPDVADKERESELIVKLLRLEKILAAADAKKAARGRDEAPQLRDGDVRAAKPRDRASRGDRPRDGASRGDRPRDAKPRSDRPRDAKPRLRDGDVRAAKPRSEKPRARPAPRAAAQRTRPKGR
jgi:hypothetical protein